MTDVRSHVMADVERVHVQVDPEGYLYVETRVSTIDPQEVLSGFLETLDPATIADRAITDHPDLDPVAGTLAVLKQIVNGVPTFGIEEDNGGD